MNTIKKILSTVVLIATTSALSANTTDFEGNLLQPGPHGPFTVKSIRENVDTGEIEGVMLADANGNKVLVNNKGSKIEDGKDDAKQIGQQCKDAAKSGNLVAIEISPEGNIKILHTIYPPKPDSAGKEPR